MLKMNSKINVTSGPIAVEKIHTEGAKSDVIDRDVILKGWFLMLIIQAYHVIHMT